MRMPTTFSDKKWGEFYIGNLFNINIGKSIDGNKINKSSGRTPYVTRKENNNGNDGFIEYEDGYLFSNVPVITIGNETAMPFVQVAPFFTGTKVNIMKLKKEVSKEVLFFIAECIKLQKNKYSFSFTINSTRLKRQKILLPINKDEEPDYEFMEQYVKLIFDKKVSHYREYALNALKALEYLEIPSLEDIEWKEFNIGGKQGLFEISSTSSSIDKNKLVVSDDGDIPYITRTDMNNGINQFVKDNQNPKYLMDEGNVITIGLDTQTVFYQPHKFFTGQNIQVLRHQKLNKHTALFLIPLIKVQMEKFNWGGNGATLGRLSRTKIMLPVDSKGEPNWVYMEQYSKNLEYTKLNQYLEFLEDQKRGIA